MIKKINFVHIFWFFFYLLITAVLLYGAYSYLDPDLGWHLKVGEEIYLSGQVPHINYYNFTFKGDWVDHEWLSNLIIYRLYESFGYPMIVTLFAGLILFVLILQARYLSKLYGIQNFWLIAVFQIFGVLASLPHFGVRIQELALLFVLLLLIIIDKYTSSKKIYLLLAFLPIFYLWANLHASFLIGFFILIAWWSVKLGEWLINKYKLKNSYFDTNNPFSLSELWLIIIFICLSVAATLFTPYKIELYSFLAGYSNSAYLSLIQEWLPQYSYPFLYSQLIYLALGSAAVILYIYNNLKKGRGIQAWKILLTIVFLVLSFKSRRHFPLFYIVSLPLIIETFSQYFSNLKIFFHLWLKSLVIICLLLITVAKVQTIKFVGDPFNSFCHKYPCKAVDYLKNNAVYDNKQMLNSYGWGGYMIWVIPQRQIFIDGRLPQVAYQGWSFIEEYYSFYESKERAKANLDKHDIELVLLGIKNEYPKVKKWENIIFKINENSLSPKDNLKEYLNSSNEWQIIYQDETAVIYEKL